MGTPSRTDFAIASGLAIANALTFLAFGFHARIPLWIFSFGFVDLALGSGFFATAYWVPRIIAETPKEARILTYSFWLTMGLIMVLPGLL